MTKRAKTFAARGEPMLALRIDGLVYERAGSCSNEGRFKAALMLIRLTDS